MPRGDGTGPQGQGPKTGRGMGPCPPTGQTGQQGWTGTPYGQGSGRNRRGLGRGRGFRAGR